MNILITIILIAIAIAFILSAFILVIIRKGQANQLDQLVHPYQDERARAIEARASRWAAILIIVGSTILIVFPFFNPRIVTIDRQLSPTPGTSTFVCVSNKTIKIDGSTALRPLVENIAQDYRNRCPKAQIIVKGGGSQVGLSDVENGTVDIGDSDIPLGIGQSDLIDHPVAVVAFAIIINNSVTGVTNLTTKQLQDIYRGSITNWQTVGGPDMPIDLLIRSFESGARATFEQYVLRFSHKLGTVINEGQMESAVQARSGAIGYVDLATATQNINKAKIVSIDSYTPTVLDFVKNNNYKFWNYEHMYTKGLPPSSSLTYAFMQYMTSSSVDAFIAQLFYIKFNDMSASALIEHNKIKTVPPN